MTAKEWLERGRGIESEIKLLREEQNKAFAAATSMGAVPKGEKVQTSKTNTAESKMIRYAEYSAKLDSRIAELVRVKAEILDGINSVPDTVQRCILFLRYICGMPWGLIADTLNYERRQVFRFHAAALKKIDAFLKDVPKCHKMSLNVTT